MKDTKLPPDKTGISHEDKDAGQQLNTSGVAVMGKGFAPAQTEQAASLLVDGQETEADRKWKEAFANTTEEEFERLEKMLVEEEEKYGLMPLDFTGK